MTAPDTELQAAVDRIGQTIARATLRALRSNASDFALTGRWRPEAQRIVYLFGRAYWWDRDPDGKLTLQPAVWINAPAPPRLRAAARRRPGTGQVSTPGPR